MSIYEYECCECGAKQELIRKIKDMEKPVWCEECNGQCRLLPPYVSKFVRGKGNWSSPA